MRRAYITFNVILLVILGGWIILTKENTDNCVFNVHAITDDFLKDNQNIQSYIWSDKDKTAYVLLKSGEYVFIKKWACTHYGMEAKKISMFPQEEQTSIKHWQKDMLSFGEQFLDVGNFEAYKEAVEKIDWTQGKNHLVINDRYKIDIPGFSYPEFYVMLERKQDMVMTTIYYYMD